MGDSSNKINKFVVAAGMAFILSSAAVSQPSAGTNTAVQAICSHTDYKETCEKSLARANTADPIELIKLALDAAVENIRDALKNSALSKEAAADPSTKDAYDVCQEVLGTAVDDLKRAVVNIDALDPGSAVGRVQDINTWLGAVIANQETCVDAFAETSTEMSGRMKNLLSKARELSSNVLAMMSESKSILSMLFGGGELTVDEPERRVPGGSRIHMKPTIVVAQDGSGQFKTIGEAIASLPEKNNDSVVIYVKAGLYDEQVKIPKKVNNVMLVGDGPKKTRITGNKCNAKGLKTLNTATFVVEGEDFLATNIAFENTAGPDGGQAVALRVSGDKAIFFNVAVDGYQDALYAHTYRQYYRDCTISGTVDFVFGHSVSLFQNCQFIVRKPGGRQACTITADGRSDARSVSGIVIQNGNITAEPAFLAARPPHKAFLGRPWKKRSTTIIMQSNIEGFIDPTGWSPWHGNFALDTCDYAEYDNRGPGSNTTNRVKWKGIRKLTRRMAEGWTGGVVFDHDEWIKQAGVPYVPTLMQL